MTENGRLAAVQVSRADCQASHRIAHRPPVRIKLDGEIGDQQLDSVLGREECEEKEKRRGGDEDERDVEIRSERQ
jgi:hypothetical protein